MVTRISAALAARLSLGHLAQQGPVLQVQNGMLRMAQVVVPQVQVPQARAVQAREGSTEVAAVDV
jgi:hypothetical protein